MITKAILFCLNLFQKLQSLICQLGKSINLLQKDGNDKTEIVTQMTKPDNTKPKSSKETFVISISNRVGRWIWGSLGLAANNLQSWRETTFSPSSFKTGCWLRKHVILLFLHRFGERLDPTFTLTHQHHSATNQFPPVSQKQIFAFCKNTVSKKHLLHSSACD